MVTRPLYILSFRQRDELAALAAEGDRPVVATRRATDAARRFVASGAAVAVVDLRGARDEGAAAVAELADLVVARGAALVVLVSRGDLARLDDLRSAGATHFLASPFAEEEFRQTLRFAEASADRRDGSRVGAPSGAALEGYLGRDLERALAADEIEVLFQPQVDMATGTVTGAEALMRWRHPELGELGAERLLDAAERAGLVPALSAHVHARALGEAGGWPEDLRLSLNVTAEDLAETDFAAGLAEQVADSGVAAGRITLEVTERGLIEEPERAAAVLADLRARGFRTAIDDFGTGYSSIAYLSQLPLDYLKLDRVLTQDIGGSSRDRTVVKGVIELAHSLNLTVIAEGVETEPLREALARAGVAQWQGFLCSEPVSAAQVAALARPRAS